ncbi:MAG TPA: response regulator transcription factor [Tepidisphaeraceae bacterium]
MIKATSQDAGSSAEVSRPIRVVVADDHPVVRNGVAAILGAQPDIKVVAEAPDGASAIELYIKHRPDVMLVDLKMPDLDGLDVIARICESFPDASLVVLTTYDTEDDIDRGIRAGARGFMLKDATPQQLVTCVREVHAGRMSIAPAVAARLANRLTRATLTPREGEVLHLLADGKSNKEIAAALSITEGTVKLHVNNLFQKLGVQSRTEAMKAAIQRGLIRI